MHFEDQLASAKTCGHLGGKVPVPIGQHIRTLNAARLAAQLLTTDVEDRDAMETEGYTATRHQREVGTGGSMPSP